ncbi:WecB/TagA/CpsF family glycosyltransferase [Methylococcus sp. EFPC2]|uniref:WecB/TagA/CpsF family glycosyltransferase n=1 Tax=Methylococcus sp. EFPC2 TaxID=2812648 RepID=UPI0019677E7B|nr:WecB/TagA/CpsF family glycosyltransferase [Methylococcus sp. EFPC2]QSA98930.1 WecB/TagA/CpsF family glycosyltransferase [Methylococcus sp. EFPC2]
MDVRASLLGISIPLASLQEITEKSVGAIAAGSEPLTFVCANPHSLVEAQKDLDFFRALKCADLIVADGVGVTVMARISNISIGPRITGADYFFSLMTSLNESGGGRVFFFGSSQHVLDLISQRFVKTFPSLELCGVLSPPFGLWSEDENQRMIEQINAAKPDVLWVGMTAPKQEKWVEANRTKLSASVIGSIGAVFDFFAGTYPRAPDWMCQLGIEFVYRLLKEPKRMWRRNFISTPHFISLVVKRHILDCENRA